MAHDASCELACDEGYTLTGDQPSCDAGVLTAMATCVQDVDCVGSWSSCTVDCTDIEYTVTVLQGGSGASCEAEHGATATCMQGDGECTGACTEDSDCGDHGSCPESLCVCADGYTGGLCATGLGCTGVAAVDHGTLGDCPVDGTLSHGESCSLACDATYTLVGVQPSCDAGVLNVVSEPV
eukprot:SAG11_NODE_9400_length_916_cov_0.735618_1_plen_180_part_10